ncbi:hypothetical protein ASPBRDRAFT_31345 [Aspergillus brasiliensis CBS 101740]|uniref:Uncharacterized protein n=1 Tax=Aspergillus brasiliensis (strain CBS 101740 / IMI 381727 / IBT 21946) TaxID=767769 RepID=A0A1L9UFL4_ASPBC|nr:hypothetical protein ASPBRDRAFT_31345 [Aspergillus brasiliensis CBS 101740]
MFRGCCQHEAILEKYKIAMLTWSLILSRRKINLSLDLKEKYTASQDAAFGRQQAISESATTAPRRFSQLKSDDNSHLPLIFLSSVFALNIAQFPHGPTGRPEFQSWWIPPLIFGPSAAAAIPLIVVAFNVNDFIVTPYYKWKAARISPPTVSGPGRQPSGDSDEVSQGRRRRVRLVFSRETQNKTGDDEV